MSVLKNEMMISVKGMRCASCVGRVEDHLLKLPEVAKVNVNLAAEKVSIHFKSTDNQSKTPSNLQTNKQTNIQDLKTFEMQETLKDKVVKAIIDAGYEPVLLNTNVKKQSSSKNILIEWYEKWKVVISLTLSLPLMLPMLGVHLSPYIQWLLATPIQFVIGYEFYKSAFFAIKTKFLNMDVLVSIGTSAAYFLSVYLLFENPHEHLYFESSAMVISLVLLGKYLEHKAKQKTLKALESLESLKPARAQLYNSKTNQFEDVPIEMITENDIVLVRPSERIPVDGEIVEGAAQIDESFLTGESLPVFKTVKQKVLCGSLNTDGVLKIKVTTKSQEATLLQQIIESVESAQMSKAPIHKKVDQVSRVFVPVVLIVSLITLIGWFIASGGSWQVSIINAVSVLVIACPCALGLATPTTMMVGTGLAALRGILIKDMESFELLHQVKVMAFDKTGTLTMGQPQVTSFQSIDAKENENDLIQISVTLQKNIHHPLAQAVIKKFENIQENIQSLVIKDLKSIPGYGVEGVIDDQKWIFGSQKLLEMYNTTNNIKTNFNNLHQPNQTTSYLARVSRNKNQNFAKDNKEDCEVMAVFTFQDKEKPDSQSAIIELKKRKIKTYLITGDNQATAQRLSTTLGLDEFFAEVLPHDKMSILQKLKSENQTLVAMVGDGVNDALALTSADVGIAMGNGTDVAMHSAGVTLLKGNPLSILEAMELSYRTSQKIKQSLFWAFIFNVLGIPLAAFGYLNPMIAGGAMALSSVSVVTNALSLGWFYKKTKSYSDGPHLTID